MFTKKVILAAAILGGFAVSTLALADAETNTLLKNPYQQEAANCSATVGPSCTVVFPATTDAVTEITWVSCFFFIEAGGQVYGAYLGTANTNFHAYVQPFIYFNQQTNVSWGISAATTLFVNKGDSPRIVIQTLDQNPYQLDCTISGYHS
jgi:hypothetical protein